MRRGWLRWLLVALVALACVSAWLAWALREPWLVAQQRVLVRTSGAASALTLACALCVSPLTRSLRALGRKVQLDAAARLRRGLGMAAACLALVHASLALALGLDFRLALTWLVPGLRAGLCALVILLLLLATSFPAWVRAMRLRTWKELHVLAFVAFALTLQHVLLSPFAPRTLALSLFGAVTAIGCLRFLPRR